MLYLYLTERGKRHYPSHLRKQKKKKNGEICSYFPTKGLDARTMPAFKMAVTHSVAAQTSTKVQVVHPSFRPGEPTHPRSPSPHGSPSPPPQSPKESWDMGAYIKALPTKQDIKSYIGKLERSYRREIRDLRKDIEHTVEDSVNRISEHEKNPTRKYKSNNCSKIRTEAVATISANADCQDV